MKIFAIIASGGSKALKRLVRTEMSILEVDGFSRAGIARDGRMSSEADHTVSRRAALTGFAITAAYGSVIAKQASDSMSGGNGVGPVFSPSGPNAELYGAAEGFPIADHSLAHQPGDPYQVKYRVGAHSHFDEIYPTHRIERAAPPWMFKHSQAARQGHAGVRLWLFSVAASGSQTPVRVPRRQRPTHLRRSNLEADHGPDGCRRYR